MLSFLVDEDLPRSLAPRLKMAGHDAVDVRDVGLRGKKDDEIRAYALKKGLTLLTGDIEFGNILHYPPKKNGTLLVRLDESISAETRVNIIIKTLEGLTPRELEHCVGVIGADGLRLRKTL